MTDDKAVLVDTNVLLSATAPLRPLHRAAMAVLNDWPNQGTLLATSSQVLREYLAVATRPVAVNGLGLGLEDALANVTALRGRMRLLVDSEPAWDRLGRRARKTLNTRVLNVPTSPGRVGLGWPARPSPGRPATTHPSSPGAGSC